MKKVFTLSLCFGICLLCSTIGNAQKWSALNQKMIAQYSAGELDSAVMTGKAALDAAAKEFKKKGPDYGTALFNMGFLLSEGKEPATAIPYYSQCILVREKALGKDSKEYINVVNNLAEVYYKLERYQDVEPLYRELLQLITLKHGVQSKDYAVCCQNLGSLFLDAGRNDSSLCYYRKSLDVLAPLSGEKDENYLYVLNMVAFGSYKSLKYKDAITYYTKLAELRKELLGATNDDYATAMNNLAMMYRCDKQYDQSVQTYELVLGIKGQKKGEMSPDYAFVLNNLAAVYMDQYLWNQAFPLLKKVLAIRKSVLGEQHPDYAVSMNNLAYVFEKMSVYDSAIICYRKVVDLRKEIYGEHHPEYATALFELASSLKEMGFYKEAETDYLLSGDIRKQVFGEQSEEYATVLNNLGSLYWTQDDYPKAEQNYLSSMAIKAAIAGKDNSDYAITLQNIALLHQDMGDMVKAEAELKEVQQTFINLKLTETPDYVYLLNSLANFYLETEAFAKVEGLFLEALQLCARIQGKESKEYAGLLSGLSNFYRTLGNYTKAEPLLLESLRIREKLLGKHHKDYAASLLNLGNLYYYTGDYPLSEKCFTEAADVYASALGKQNPNYAGTIESLGNLYRRMGNYSKAEALYLQSMAIKKEVFGENHDRYAMILSNLAGCYKDQGKYAKAEPLYLQALAIQKSLFSQKNTTYATYIDNIGVLYTLMKQYDKALQYYTEALDFYKSTLGENHPEVGLTLNNMGTLYLEKGDYVNAEKYITASLELRKSQQGEGHPDYAMTLNDLAYCYFLMGDYAKAEPWYEEANAKTVFQIAHNYPTLSEQEKAMFYSVIDNNFSGFNRFTNMRAASNPAIAGDAMNNQLATASMLLENSRNVRLQVLSSGDTSLISKYSKWMMLRTEIGKAYMMTESERSTLQFSTNEMEQQANNLEKELLTQLQSRGVSLSGSLKWQDVQASLGTDEAVIEFVNFTFTHQQTKIDSTVYAALVLKKGDPYPIWIPLFEEKQLYAMLNDTSIRYADNQNRGLTVNNAKMGPRFGPLNPEIYSLLWRPLESALSNVKTVFLCPAGLLNKISFAALRPDSATYLSDRYSIRYLLTSRDLARAKSQTSGARPGMQAVVAGGADFNAGVTAENLQRSGNWTYLPGTKLEAESINALLSKGSVKVKLLEGAAASEEQIKALSGHAPEVLHLSTHGFFFSRNKKVNAVDETDPLFIFKSAENPLLRSGLVLSGVNQVWAGSRPKEGVEDGVLTAYEVANLDLNNTKLVVLSACETGLGDIKAGEGVFGLQRAFRLAGAGCIMLSMWEVPDKETVELMQSFYTFWTAGHDIHTAFAEAQEGMRKKYPNEPAKWAGFILIE